MQTVYLFITIKHNFLKYFQSYPFILCSAIMPWYLPISWTWILIQLINNFCFPPSTSTHMAAWWKPRNASSRRDVITIWIMAPVLDTIFLDSITQGVVIADAARALTGAIQKHESLQKHSESTWGEREYDDKNNEGTSTKVDSEQGLCFCNFVLTNAESERWL